MIEHAYRDFLLHNSDPDDREYSDPADQIREALIHENYLSHEDIEICLGFRLSGLRSQIQYAGMHELHASLIMEYGPGGSKYDAA